MIIEVNLLPGAKKSKRGGGGGGKALDFAAIGAAISNKVKDKWLASAVACGLLAAVAVGMLFWTQRQRESGLKEEEAKAIADSVQFASVLRDRMVAQAKRDSALTQLMIIRAIDEDRLIWPHFLEEVSRALPIYTWLRQLTITGTNQGINPAAAIKTPPPVTPDPKRPNRKSAEVFIPRDTVRVRMIGRTVDVQAFTRFMRSLEDSPFVEGVVMQRTESLVEAGKELTQFTIEVTYSRPDTSMLKRAPIVFNQR
jgi:Tfp pilus assembly protein PilN